MLEKFSEYGPLGLMLAVSLTALVYLYREGVKDRKQFIDFLTAEAVRQARAGSEFLASFNQMAQCLRSFRQASEMREQDAARLRESLVRWMEKIESEVRR